MKAILSALIAIFLVMVNVRAQLFTAEENNICADCHEDIYRQWENSMHGKSTAESDILYKAMLNWAIEDTKGKAKKMCVQCHTPYQALKEEEGITESDLNRPVDCVYCHSLENIQNYPKFSKTFYGPRDNNREQFHKIEKRTHFTDATLCLTCHGELKNPKQVSVCITGDEFMSRPDKSKICQDCHMPKTENKDGRSYAQHSFLGVHNPEFLRKSLSLKTSDTENGLEVAITNDKAAHAYPTGSPLRQVIVKVVAKDKDDNLVFENWKENPLKEDKQAVFMRIFEDENKNAPVPPWRGTAVKMDQRLAPGETRILKYDLPENAQTVTVKLVFRLAPLPILKRLGINDPYLYKAHLIDEKTVQLH
ncbi:MAG TPA: hypothetical protein EYP36_09340 [Calditrichaeota bacterium]|nr:hypothetical protein [Calditrichota bacterium]